MQGRAQPGSTLAPRPVPHRRTPAGFQIKQIMPTFLTHAVHPGNFLLKADEAEGGQVGGQRGWQGEDAVPVAAPCRAPRPRTLSRQAAVVCSIAGPIAFWNLPPMGASWYWEQGQPPALCTGFDVTSH